MEVYLLNVIRPTRLVTSIMAAQGDGAIINILTFAAFEPDPAFPTSAIFQILGYAAIGSGWSSASCGRTGPSCLIHVVVPGSTVVGTASR